MVLMHDPPPAVRALVGFGMNSPNAPRLTAFYERAFGARVTRRRRRETNGVARWLGIPGGAASILLSLGDATVEVLEFDHPGRPYPRELSPYDTRFQHLGIVVADMQGAMESLSQTDGWSPISTSGPQQLPAADGGVIAFKFRDPDGHPLEFLQFRADSMPAHWRGAAGSSLHRGIDHSALSVADADRSVRFYESLGLRESNRTLNRGGAQERLDGVPAPQVDVIGLAPPTPTPHVELLHYHAAERPTHEAPAANDTAATRLIFTARAASAADALWDGASSLIQDPDGHFLQFLRASGA